MVGAETIPPLVCSPLVMNCSEKKGFTICEFCKAVKILVAHHKHSKEIFYTVIIVLVFAEKKKNLG